MPKLANAPPVVSDPRHQTLNAIVLLYDTLQSEREKGCAMELFLAFVYRAWGWTVEKFKAEFDEARHG